MRRLVYVATIIFALFIAYSLFNPKTRGCKLEIDHLTIDTVRYGPFVESILANGTLKSDTIPGAYDVKVPIDVLYLSRISKGLKATTIIRKKDYELEITMVHPSVNEGRFHADMKFSKKTPDTIPDTNLRLRLELSERINANLLSVGGFYKDTDGGQWVFVLDSADRAVKRPIRLGRKSFNYFEVVEGLKPGDRVITSSYESFLNRDHLDLSEIKKSYPSSW